ncbi:MAG TPA: TonB-dependent receptor [Kofleriaceae bacterium]|nr:TonB-dependent receptor [Kofleriaceae bacterium]
MAALLGDAPAALAQESGLIRGRVVSQTGEPIVGATISVEPTGAGAFTDEEGHFQIEAAPGKYSLQVSFSGYAPQVRNVSIGDAPVQLIFTLRDDPRYAEKITIVGGRTQVSVGARTPRSVTRSPVAIDVISSEQIQEAGNVETNQVLRTVAPSYNASHQMIADGTDHIDPASLRGLGPDQTLVLINGKRRHSSSLVNVNGTFGRGTVGVDLNAIPTSAIEWIEVLRDGASAQYGSDAIAGVVNLELKEAPGVVEANALSGLTAEGDGFQLMTGLNYGIPVGKRGVVNLTGEFVQRNRTDRSGPFTGLFYPDDDGDKDPSDDDARLADAGLTRQDVSINLGQSQATVGMFFLNARVPFGSKTEFYSTGGLTYRSSEAAGFYRLPFQQTRVDPQLYPQGFLPRIRPTIFDWSAGAGVRTDRESDGFRWDVSVNHGGNWLNYEIDNSVNASLGPDSPTSFDSGGFLFDQSSANVDLVYPIPTDAIKRIAVNGGAEYRLENYSIHAGQDASWQLGTAVVGDDPNQPKEAGAQVFPGFQPENEVDEFRNSVASYLGVETELNDRLMVDVAGRFENYQDFGSTLNGKIAGRLALIDEVALRAAASTGFRAPSLHQTYFNSTSTQFVTTETGTQAVQVVTAKNNGDIAAEFAVPALKEETSLNASGGFTITPVENFTLTADGYYIHIDNRIVLTSQFNEMTVPGTAEILADLGGNVSAAQFFSNAVNTSTTGADVVLDFWSDMGAGRFEMTGAANFTRTEVVKVNVPQSVADRFGAGSQDALREAYFNREEENRLEDALPHQRGMVQGRYNQGPITGLLRANYWGSVVYKHPTMPDADENFGAKVTLDADLGYELPAGLKIAVGASNLLNTFPDEQKSPINIADGQFIYSRRVTQFGVNGGFYYLRLQYLY